MEVYRGFGQLTFQIAHQCQTVWDIELFTKNKIPFRSEKEEVREREIERERERERERGWGRERERERKKRKKERE